MTHGAMLVLALAMVGSPPSGPPQETLTLALRVFDGGDEVTPEIRVMVHRAGQREAPLAQTHGAAGPIELKVAEGIYDVQAIHLRDGQVLNIGWANRLVVMPYPDEGGYHLEVVNFRSGFGALQVRARDAAPPDVALHAPGEREKPAATPLPGTGYTLFVVPAGVYDLRVRVGERSTWHTGIEVPLDRTRLWLQP